MQQKEEQLCAARPLCFADFVCVRLIPAFQESGSKSKAPARTIQLLGFLGFREPLLAS
jgi:hypothetical protein